MVNILSSSQIVQKLIEFFSASQPNLTTNPGSVARDLFVDGPGIYLGELYDELRTAAAAQSFSSAVGTDLENYASNFSVFRAPPGKSSGIALLTFNSVTTDIPIPTGSLIYAKNGLSFTVPNGFIIYANNEPQYRAVATTYKTDLDYLNITDTYAVEVLVECTSTGTQGNIAKYGLISISVPGITNATNLAPFTGGSPIQTDGDFRNTVTSIFSGSSSGTSLGYNNLVKANNSVLDVVVVEPGDPYMERDGTILLKDSNGNIVLDSSGNPTVLSEGSGGKVDIYAYGRRILENLDSFIYYDKSGKSDPTSTKNYYVLGQISQDDITKTITKRRYNAKTTGVVPNQPVVNIVEVIGSRSGVFTPQYIDSLGIKSGNYELLKDTGVFNGSCFGFDKLHWINNKISYSEDLTKNKYNGQDSITYSDVTTISEITRTVPIYNENSSVSATDRSLITLYHTPVGNVNKVLNVTTGERYTITNRNTNGNVGDLNTTGVITISGKNLPSPSHTLQVDYDWQLLQDPFVDYYSFRTSDNPRTAIDVVDWGYCNAIRREDCYINDGYTVTTTHNVSSVISVNIVNSEGGPPANSRTISLDENGNKVIKNLSKYVTNVVSVTRVSDGAELFNTIQDNGSFDTNTIILPSDTVGVISDSVVVVYNALDLFTISSVSGTFSENVITLPQASWAYVSLYTLVEVNYIADVSELVSNVNFSELPATRSANLNQFSINRTSGSSSYTILGIQPWTNKYSGTSPYKNLRRSPSKLGLTVSSSTSPGIVNINGTTSILIKDAIFTATENGFEQDIQFTIKQALGLDVNANFPSNIQLYKLISLEKVVLSGTSVYSVSNTYDITGYSLADNSFDLDNAIPNTTLTSTQFILPSTTSNTTNEPILGDTFRINCYVKIIGDSELISFTTNGTLYTNKNFIFVERIAVSSGFTTNSNLVGTISAFPINQPPTSSRYTTKYSYTAPKPGERISIRYNSNALIGDLSLTLEQNKVITSDVMIKSASSALVDVIATITVLTEYTNSKYLVAQNVGDKIANAINNIGLGGTLNPSDLINVAYQVSGLDSIVINRFNLTSATGNVQAIKLLKYQYMQANSISIQVT